MTWHEYWEQVRILISDIIFSICIEVNTTKVFRKDDIFCLGSQLFLRPPSLLSLSLCPIPALIS